MRLTFRENDNTNELPLKNWHIYCDFFLVMSSFCLQSDMRAHYDDNPLELEKLAVGVRIGSVIL